MKTFGDLTYKERDAAVERAKDLLIEHIVQGIIEIKMPNKIAQRNLNMILLNVRKNETPSLAKELMTADVSINRELDKISIEAAEVSQYDVDNKFLM